MDIEIALLVRDDTYLNVPQDLREASQAEVAWEDRPRITMHLTTAAKMSKVISDAARDFGVTVKKGRYFHEGTDVAELFMYEYDFHGALPDMPVAPLVLANSDGSAKWLFDPNEVRFSDILAARDAQVFLGDPQKFYLLVDEPHLPVGNGLDYWQQVFEALGDLHSFLKAAGEEAGPYVFFGGVLLGARKFVKSQHDKLFGGEVKKYQQLFRLPRTDEQVAKLLRVDVESVPNLMGLFGLRKDRDGHWRPLHSPEMTELRELAAVLDTLGHWYLDENVRNRVFSEVLSHPVGERERYTEPTIRRLLKEQLEE